MSGRRPISLRKQVELARAGWALEERRRRGLCLHVRPLSDVPRSNQRRTQRVSTEEAKWTSFERLQELNRELLFEPLSDVDAERLEDEAREYSSDDALDRHVCLVTDTWVFPCSAVRIGIASLPIRAMQAVLKGGPWCTSVIREYYDCSSIDSRLQNLLLSRRAFERSDDGALYAWISTAAHNDLCALQTRLEHSREVVADARPPRFAIADGFVAGSLAEVTDATCVEIQTVGLAQLRGVVKVVYGGPGNMLNSHMLCWDNRDASIASRVPSVVTRERFQLILAGPMTPAQEVLLARRHECSGDRIRRLHELLCRINPLYAGIAADEVFLGNCDGSASITTRLQDGEDTQQLVAHARARQSTVARGRDAEEDNERRECTVVESQTVLLETTADRSEQDRLERAFANITSTNTTYVARRSTSILQSTDPHYMERLFPHLLTFGIGGFSMNSRHRYSPRAVVLHYLNLSTNQFAEDSMYKLMMFDYISTKRVKSGVSCAATTVSKVMGKYTLAPLCSPTRSREHLCS